MSRMGKMRLLIDEKIISKNEPKTMNSKNWKNWKTNCRTSKKLWKRSVEFLMTSDQPLIHSGEKTRQFNATSLMQRKK